MMQSSSVFRATLRQLILNTRFLSVSVNHLAIDFLNSQVPLMLAFLSKQLDLSNSDIGLATALYIGISSLLQPVFGWLSDRHGARWFVGGGLLWMSGWFIAAVTVAGSPAGGRAAILLLVIGGIGSGSFHPAGTESATTSGVMLMAGRAATASSIFFLFGQAGLGIGPWIGGVLLEKLGLPGIIVLSALAVPVAFNTLYRLRPTNSAATAETARATASTRPRPSAIRTGPLMLALFVLLVILRIAPQSVLMTFIPKLLLDQGHPPSYQGAMLAAFMIGSALGGVAGGILADNFGRRRAILLTLLAAIVPLYMFPVSSSWAAFVWVALAGATIGASHSVTVVLAQSLLPGNVALASGLVLGLMFASGSTVAYLFGLLADEYPLVQVLQLSALLALVAATLSLTLKGDSPDPIEQA